MRTPFMISPIAGLTVQGVDEERVYAVKLTTQTRDGTTSEPVEGAKWVWVVHLAHFFHDIGLHDYHHNFDNNTRDLANMVLMDIAFKLDVDNCQAKATDLDINVHYCDHSNHFCISSRDRNYDLDSK